MTHHDLSNMILKYPTVMSWTYEDGSTGGFSEYPKFDFPENLSNEWKVLTCTITYNEQEVLPNYGTFERVLGIPKKELQKIVKALKGQQRLSVMPTFNQDTGLISGSGFYGE